MGLEFIPATHTYLLDGILLHSVTQIVSWVVHKDYSGVPAETLNKKADYGNRIHEWVEHYATTGERKPQTKLMEISTEQWVLMQDVKKIHITDVEQPIHYRDLYAGTYDMLGYREGKRALFDIKTTAEYDAEYLSYQMALYKYAIELSDEWESIEECFCVWMPKSKLVKLIEVKPKSVAEIAVVLERFKEAHPSELPF